MELNTYQTRARRSRLPTADAAYVLINLTGEVGELNSLIAKAVRDDHEIDAEKVKLELGDILWHLAAIADDFNMSLDLIARANIKKLTDRKKSGTIKGSGDNR